MRGSIILQSDAFLGNLVGTLALEPPILSNLPQTIGFRSKHGSRGSGRFTKSSRSSSSKSSSHRSANLKACKAYRSDFPVTPFGTCVNSLATLARHWNMERLPRMICCEYHMVGNMTRLVTDFMMARSCVDVSFSTCTGYSCTGCSALNDADEIECKVCGDELSRSMSPESVTPSPRDVTPRAVSPGLAKNAQSI